jgi:anthranilate phosphoribosyltransferase
MSRPDPNKLINEAIKKLVEKKDLTLQEAMGVMNQIMSGGATDAQIGSFITALRIKGETVEEITGCAIVMREKALKVNVNTAVCEVVDTCGTGGDGMNTFNISTASAFVVAGAGIKVAKHGNKSVSSKCGSADVLQELGVKIDLTPELAGRAIDEIGIGFIFAPMFHGAMKYAIGPRKEIGIRTVFNVLGPLTNPACATAQVIGVYDEKMTGVLAQVLKNIGVKRAFIVHGEDGTDEFSITGSTKVAELKNGEIINYNVSPEEFGLKKAGVNSIKGGEIKENANIVLAVLKGEKGPCRDVVLMNASAAIMAGGRSNNFREGAVIAAESIDLGKALEKLEQLIKFGK